MKFTPRLPEKNVNVSKVNPLKEFFVLSAGIIGIIFIVYFTLGMALEYVVANMPVKTELTLVSFFAKKFPEPVNPSPAQKSSQKIMDSLVSHLSDEVLFQILDIDTRRQIDEVVQYMFDNELKFKVYILDSESANALAFPGGHVVLFRGLLNEVESENELAMILAHELGHYVHRDHLKGLGRGLVLVALSSILLGGDSTVTNFIMNTLNTANLRFSRANEAAADQFALGLLVAKYGHAASATDFFERMLKKENMPEFTKYFSTHPHHRDRIKWINKKIELNDYGLGKAIPLGDEFKGFTEPDDKTVLK